ncbi:MAG TPA: acyl-CoA dehydrogenase [Baekduia sp.]|uniref:acyl-CoA dehydrogenase family protein n=1 Tax=Baekduia sp. TaxID=2600305 RepID=UPI002D79E0CB|nr:acyl-CoA dehydrogenase [Baekduia sp.]HET6509872.1 acyl-CoA dehydrogenase [Baekduia sp.]
MSAVADTAPTLTPERLASFTEIAARRAEHVDRTATFPGPTLRDLHDAGAYDVVFADHVSLVELSRLVQAVSQGDPAAGLILVNSIHAIEKQRARQAWPARLYEDFLAAAARGPVSLNSARAEPELGAPARGGLPKTTAHRTADGWSLSGRKAYVTGAADLDYHFVWAKTDEARPRVGHLIVPRGTPGIEVIETWDHLGLRGSGTHDVVYADVVVPEEHFLEIPFTDGVYVDPVGRGGPSSLLHAVIYVGVARAAQEAFATFARERVPSALGRPIATTERIQSVAGAIEGLIVTAEELVYGLTARAEAGDADAVRRTQIAKPVIARNAIEAVQTAVAALGNPALSRSHPLERHLRDVLCARVHPPQEDAARVAVGRRVLGQ